MSPAYMYVEGYVCKKKRFLTPLQPFFSPTFSKSIFIGIGVRAGRGRQEVAQVGSASQSVSRASQDIEKASVSQPVSRTSINKGGLSLSTIYYLLSTLVSIGVVGLGQSVSHELGSSARGRVVDRQQVKAVGEPSRASQSASQGSILSKKAREGSRRGQTSSSSISCVAEQGRVTIMLGKVKRGWLIRAKELPPARGVGRQARLLTGGVGQPFPYSASLYNLRWKVDGGVMVRNPSFSRWIPKIPLGLVNFYRNYFFGRGIIN